MAEMPESGPSRLQRSSQPPTSPSRSEVPGEHGEQAPGTAERAKRKADGPVQPKNLQACDRCRAKKIKCQPSDNHRDVCRACSTVPATCTFDMPLTASRTKRIRRGMSQAIVGPGGVEEGAGTHMARSESRDDNDEERDERQRSGESGRRSFSWIGATPSAVEIFREARSLRLTNPARTTSVRREGPTSISYILHSTPTLPISYLSDYDTHHCLSMSFTPPESGDGFILVATELLAPSSSDPPPHVVEALHSPSWNEVVNRLVETYLVHVSPLIPIVLREEMGEASLLMTHAMAAVAAARKNCPKEIFDCLQYILKQKMYEQDTLSDPTRQNVQILLISCLIDDLALESGAAAPASVQRARLSAAIRMAQDLSMDNPIPDTLIGEADARIWQCAIILDQWNAARTGARPIIHNALLPPFTPSPSSRPRDPDMEFFQQLFSLSLILCRILGKVYGPEGVKRTTNADLHGIRDDLLKWKEELSGKLKFSGVWSSLPAGILHLLHTTLIILLYRPFMRFSFICPAHLDLSLDLPVWITLNSATRHALEWAANQDDLADLLFFGPYALVLACLIQYHSYARRREWDGVVMLEKFQRDAVDRWTSRASGGHLVLQASQLEIISLFYAATQNTLRTGTTSYDSPTSPRGLNPTPGILNRLPETSIHGVTFLRDPTHPQGGVLVATQQAAREIKDLPAGTVIIGAPEAVRVTGEGGAGAAGVGVAVVGHTGQAGGGAESSVQNQQLQHLQPGQHGPAPYDALSNANGPFTVGGALLDGLGAGGRMSMSTPDWEAIVSSFTFGGADAGAVGGGAIGGGTIGGGAIGGL